jgi:iron complex transport system ATP-binding protein
MGCVMIEARAVSYRYPSADRDAVHEVGFALGLGEAVAVVGPNGSGKTTLLRLLLGVLQPQRGEVTLGQQRLAHWTRRELARLIGVVPQREDQLFPLEVGEAVLFGRYPHLGALGLPSARDRQAVQRALRLCDVAHLADRRVSTLSGGEWQRVRIARALAQEPRVLVLDEPTANLDVRHEMEVFELVADLVSHEGLGAIVVTHHVNLAARFADRVLVLDGGAVRATGCPDAVLTENVLRDVFEWPVAMTEWSGVPQFVPLRRREVEGDARGADRALGREAERDGAD